MALRKGRGSQQDLAALYDMSNTTAADIWLNNLRPWCEGVVFTAFLLMSIIQSITFFVTYSQVPMTSIVTLEKLNKNHMPWITICPNPGVSFTRLEEYFKDNSIVEDPNDQIVQIARAMSLQGITPRELEGVLGQTNDTLEGFLKTVSLPLSVQMRDCTLKETGKVQSASCNISPATPFTIGTSWLNLNSTKPMVRDTAAGNWETDFILETLTSHFYFRLCSTFQPNFALKPGKSDWLEMRFTLTMDQHYMVSSTRLRRGFEDGQGMPTFTVYLRQPDSKMESYPSLAEEGEFFELKLGQRAEFSLAIEKYVFLSSPTYKCDAEESVPLERTDCVRNCFESKFLKSTCRIPGFRNSSASSADLLLVDGEPEVCSTAKHFKAIKDNLDWTKAAKDLYTLCSDLCPRPCTKFIYEGKDVTNAETANSRVVSNFTNSQGDRGRKDSLLKFSVKSPYVKVVEQQYAFGMHQLIGELGGTWGLFLGLSIVSVLDFLEKGLLIVLEKFSW